MLSVICMTRAYKYITFKILICMEIFIFPRVGSERGKILSLPPQNYPRYIRTSLVNLWAMSFSRHASRTDISWVIPEEVHKLWEAVRQKSGHWVHLLRLGFSVLLNDLPLPSDICSRNPLLFKEALLVLHQRWQHPGTTIPIKCSAGKWEPG